ncbi:MAG TPA: MerR family transcriptional regulator [Trebonia sp.]
MNDDAGRSAGAGWSGKHGTLLTIGQLARRTGLPVRTIRYWSDIGAAPPAGRSDGGHRLYDTEAVGCAPWSSTTPAPTPGTDPRPGSADSTAR